MSQKKSRRKKRNAELKLYGPNEDDRYFTYYLNAEGKSRRKLLSRDKDEAVRQLRRFQVELDGGRLAPDVEEPTVTTDGTESRLSLGNLIREYTAWLRGKIREEADGHADDGTITQQTYDLHCNVCKRIARYCKNTFGEAKVLATPFPLLFDEHQYEVMFDTFKRERMPKLPLRACSRTCNSD